MNENIKSPFFPPAWFLINTEKTCTVYVEITPIHFEIQHL